MKSTDPLQDAFSIQIKAAKLGFDWLCIEPVIEKLYEEISEVLEAIHLNNPEKIEEEMGDLFFQCVNLARHLSLCPSQTLLNGTKKFEDRFSKLLDLANQSNASLKALSLEELESLWQKAKTL